MFENDSVHDLNTTFWNALRNYRDDRANFNRMLLGAMRLDWSWKRSAERYVDLYDSLPRDGAE